MNTLKPCPFCGKEPQEITLNGEPKVVCRCLVREPNIWNPRPIEDALNKRIAELKVFIDQLIEAGSYAGADKWDELVKDWKEG